MKTYGEKLTFKNETKTIKEWAQILDLKPDTLWRRLYRGWSIERVFSEKLYAKKRGLIERGKMPDMTAKWKEWAQYEGLHPKPRPTDLEV